MPAVAGPGECSVELSTDGGVHYSEPSAAVVAFVRTAVVSLLQPSLGPAEGGTVVRVIGEAVGGRSVRCRFAEHTVDGHSTAGSSIVPLAKTTCS